ACIHNLRHLNRILHPRRGVPQGRILDVPLPRTVLSPDVVYRHRMRRRLNPLQFQLVQLPHGPEDRLELTLKLRSLGRGQPDPCQLRHIVYVQPVGSSFTHPIVSSEKKIALSTIRHLESLSNVSSTSAPNK